MKTHHQRGHFRRKASASFLLPIICLLAFGFNPVRAAADTADSTAKITSWEFEKVAAGSVLANGGNRYMLVFTWEAIQQQAAVPPITISAQLPAEIIGTKATFDIYDSFEEKSGTCTVTTSQVTCALLDEYVASHPNDLKGSFRLETQLKFDESDLPDPVRNEINVTIESIENVVPVRPKAPSTGGGETTPCSKGCDWTPTANKGAKLSSYSKDDGVIKWRVALPSVSTTDSWASYDDGSLKAGLAVTVEDKIQPGQSYSSGPRIEVQRCIAHEPSGKQFLRSPVDVTKDVEDLAVSDDGLTVSFKTQATKASDCPQSNSLGVADIPLGGGVYSVVWFFQNDNHHFGGDQILSNVAAVNIAGFELPSIEQDTLYQLAGGNAGGGNIFNAMPGTPSISLGICSAEANGPVWDSVSVPAAGGFFTYEQSTSDDNIVTIIATPIPGATLGSGDLPPGWSATGDGKAVWTYQLNSRSCAKTVSVTPVTPTIEPAKCNENSDEGEVFESVILAVDSHFDYEQVVGEDGILTVTATPLSGYVLAIEELPSGWSSATDDGKAVWTYLVKSQLCETAISGGETSDSTDSEKSTISPSEESSNSSNSSDSANEGIQLFKTGSANWLGGSLLASMVLILAGLGLRLLSNRKESALEATVDTGHVCAKVDETFRPTGWRSRQMDVAQRRKVGYRARNEREQSLNFNEGGPGPISH